MEIEVDEDAVIACVDLVGRTGAKDFEIGYLRDEESEGHPVPSSEAGWYAKCTWQGHKLVVDEQSGPSEAADGLSRRLLSGGLCTHCKKKVTLGSDPDGCRWRRMAERWERGCIEPSRTQTVRGSGKSISI